MHRTETGGDLSSSRLTLFNGSEFRRARDIIKRRPTVACGREWGGVHVTGGRASGNDQKPLSRYLVRLSSAHVYGECEMILGGGIKTGV